MKRSHMLSVIAALFIALLQVPHTVACRLQ